MQLRESGTRRRAWQVREDFPGEVYAYMSATSCLAHAFVAVEIAIGRPDLPSWGRTACGSQGNFEPAADDALVCMRCDQALRRSEGQ
jgi:hypothetical protein